MNVTINGDPKQLPAGTTVLAALTSLGLQSQRVAVERNQEIVPRAAHASTELRDGDVLEIVHFVGGG